MLFAKPVRMHTLSYYLVYWFCLVLLLLAPFPIVAAEVYLDSAFGNQGKMSGSAYSLQGRGYGVVAQADGRILIAGSEEVNSQRDFSLVRLNPDGSPDTFFGQEGAITTTIGPYDDEALAVATLSDGRIILAGYSSSNQDRDFAIACYLSDGTLDQDFGDAGVVLTQIGNRNDEITSIVIGEDDSIYVSGVAEGTSGQIIVAAKYTADGYPDYSFGEEGMSLLGVGDDVVAQGIVLLADGSLIISGSYSENERSSLMLVGLNDDGSLNDSFGENGIGTNLNSIESEGYRVTVDESGLIYVAAAIRKNDNYDAALFRFLEDGSPDTDFGEGGYTSIYSGPEDDLFYDVKLLPDGRVVASGFSTSDGVRQFLLGYNASENDEFTTDVSLFTEPINISELKIIESEDDFRQESELKEIQVQELQLFDSYDEYIEPSTTVSLGQDNLIEGVGIVYSFFSSLLDDLAGFIVSDAHAEEELDDPQPSFLTQLVQLGLGIDTTGYALTVTDDGQIIVVGTATDTEGQENIVAAQFLSTSQNANSSTVSDDDSGSPFVFTLPVSAITRTGGFSGGEIGAGLGSVSKRGIVFSIAPFPVYKGDDADDSGDTGLTVTITAPTSGSTITESSTTLSVTTSDEATCGYNEGTDIGFDSMTKFPGSSQTSHSVTLTGLTDGEYTYFVRCRDSDDDEDVSSVSFTVSISAVSMATDLFDRATNFILPLAFAEDDSSNNFLSSDDDDEFLTEGQTEDGGGIGRYSSIMENLRPGTIFYVRAYAISGGRVFYGNRVQFQTADSCFIATASFGTLFHPCVKILRDFRDAFLVKSHIGNEMVNLYYDISPPVAKVIAENSVLKFLVRTLLLPFVGLAWLSLSFGLQNIIVVGVSFLMLIGYFAKKKALQKAV